MPVYSTVTQRLCSGFIAVAVLTAAFGLSSDASSSGDDAGLLDAVRTGKAFAIMRHALAPGFSDPAGFDVDDCSTQRNLSDEGRDQARAIGATFRKGGISEANVFSSAWCRCLETARLLGLGPVAKLPPLNSFFEARERRDAQTAALRDWLMDYKQEEPLVLVTHQVNITALTGSYTSSGETVIARIDENGRVAVLGSIK